MKRPLKYAGSNSPSWPTTLALKLALREGGDAIACQILKNSQGVALGGGAVERHSSRPACNRTRIDVS